MLVRMGLHTNTHTTCTWLYQQKKHTFAKGASILCMLTKKQHPRADHLFSVSNGTWWIVLHSSSSCAFFSTRYRIHQQKRCSFHLRVLKMYPRKIHQLKNGAHIQLHSLFAPLRFTVREIINVNRFRICKMNLNIPPKDAAIHCHCQSTVHHTCKQISNPNAVNGWKSYGRRFASGRRHRKTSANNQPETRAERSGDEFFLVVHSHVLTMVRRLVNVDTDGAT